MVGGGGVVGGAGVVGVAGVVDRGSVVGWVNLVHKSSGGNHSGGRDVVGRGRVVEGTCKS